LGFRKNWFPHKPKIADIGKIEKRIKTLPPGFIVRMGGMTDCFQPLELEKGITLETIELLNKHRIGYLIVTKSPIVAYPYFIKAMDKDLAHIQISVSSLNPAIAKIYEGAKPPDERIRAILSLQEKGFDVAIRLSPLIEELMDFDILNGLGINYAIVEFLRINGMQMKLPAMDYSKYTVYHKNCYHLPLEEKKRILAKVKIPNISVCEKVPSDYDYWMANFNPNKEDCCNLRICSQQSVVTK
jgi:DNA repair photolyase